MTDPLEDRSGWHKKWVDALTDWSADEMRASFAEVDRDIPTKTCDVLRGCSAPVSWAIRFHDCRLLTACDEHCALVFTEVLACLAFAGFFACDACKKTFSRQYEVITSWLI